MCAVPPRTGGTAEKWGHRKKIFRHPLPHFQFASGVSACVRDSFRHVTIIFTALQRMQTRLMQTRYSDDKAVCLSLCPSVCPSVKCLYWETRCSAIAERPRCRVRYSCRQKKKTGTGRQYFTDIMGLSSTTVM